MQQGCRECGIEGPSSNFGHQGVFFSDIFTSGGVFFRNFHLGGPKFWKMAENHATLPRAREITHQGVFFRIFSPRGSVFYQNCHLGGCFFPKFSPRGVFLNFLNLTNFEFFGKLKNFGRHRGVYVDLKLDFAKKYQNFGWKKACFYVLAAKFDQIWQFFFV